MCWSRPSGTSCWCNGTTRRQRYRQHPVPELFSGQAARVPGCGGSDLWPRVARQLRGAEPAGPARGPAAWPAVGAGPETPGGGHDWTARWSWWSRCWGRRRLVRPTCRSILRIRRTGSAIMLHRRPPGPAWSPLFRPTPTSRHGPGAGPRRMRASCAGPARYRPAARPVPCTTPRYVTYTSGSTGPAQGRESCRTPALPTTSPSLKDPSTGDRYRLVSCTKPPLSFDVSAWGVFFPPSRRGRDWLSSPVRAGMAHPAYLARLIMRQRVTAGEFVPSMLQAFLAEPAVARCSSLRQVLQRW